jgi:hypothetical protein
VACKAAREIHDAGFVRHAQQRAGDLFITAQNNGSGRLALKFGREKRIVNNGRRLRAL